VRVLDSYIHPEFRVSGCCDKGNGIFAIHSSEIRIHGNVLAYAESNIELQAVRDVQVIGNYLLNPIGPFPRGQQIQVWDRGGARSANILVEGNYAVASLDPKYSFAENQEDAFNFGGTDGVVVRDNYITGGHSDSGCGIIADVGANNVEVRNNTLIDTGQCGIGIASGTNHVVDGNRIYNRGLNQSGGNTALYVWNQYKEPCGSITVSNNIAALIRPNGTISSWWKGEGCDTTTLLNNVFGEAAVNELLPLEEKHPAPAIPPREYERRMPTPFSD
jgi:hypothetical protein